MMKIINTEKNNKGVALLAVLFIVMVITVLSVGFISRSDIELACGRNMINRSELDYLAESGLEHAKGLILNPQELDTEYWGGADRQQLASGSDAYYDVRVVESGECNYSVTSTAYREKAGERTAKNVLLAELRLDPSIALWAGNNTTVSNNATINGDVYCNGTLTNGGHIDGDVFASGLADAGDVIGSTNTAGELSLGFPAVTVDNYIANYPIVPIDSNGLFDISLGPYEPVEVCYRVGNLTIYDGVDIDGMLIVKGNLNIKGGGNIIRAGKNLPALFVTGNVTIEENGGLDIAGLALVNGGVQINAGTPGLIVTGGLFAQNSITAAGSLNVSSSPAKAAIITWPQEGVVENWSPATGAVYKSIER